MTNINRLYERELRVAIRAVRDASRLCRAVAGGDFIGSPGQERQEPRHGRRLRQPGPDLPGTHRVVSGRPRDRRGRLPPSCDRRKTVSILDRVLQHVCTATGVRRRQSDADVRPEHRYASGSTTAGQRTISDRFWTLDPIDGTKGFLRGEQYAVALALIVGGEVVVAALACPSLECPTQSETSRRPDPQARSRPARSSLP